MLPMVLFTVSCATLFDSYAPLLGKASDVLYFFVWIAAMMVAVPMTEAVLTQGSIPLIELLDFTGMGAAMLTSTAALQSTQIAMGGGDVNPVLTPVLMPDSGWRVELGQPLAR